MRNDDAKHPINLLFANVGATFCTKNAQLRMRNDSIQDQDPDPDPVPTDSTSLTPPSYKYGS